MHRRVEMRAGVLAEREIVPVPAGAAVVVARDLLHAERRALVELRRQHDLREARRQGLRQVDHAHAAAGKRGAEFSEDAHWSHSSRSSTFWLSRKHVTMSCATSPG